MHLWDPHAHCYPWLCDPQPIAFRYGDCGELRRPYLPADYRADCTGWPVAGTVCGGGVGSARSARRDGFRLPLARPLRLAERRHCPGVARRGRLGRGPGSACRPQLRARRSAQAEARTLAADFPATTIVLNHAGLPESVPSAPWREAMRTLARCENVALKISGLGNLSREHRRDVTRALLELFGPRRAMFASNYPVDRLRMSFDAIFREFDEATRGLPDAQRRRLFHDNAIAIYRMEQRHA